MNLGGRSAIDFGCEKMSVFKKEQGKMTVEQQIQGDDKMKVYQQITIPFVNTKTDEQQSEGGENMDERTEQAIQRVIALREASVKEAKFRAKMIELIALTTVLERQVKEAKTKLDGVSVKE